MNDMSGRMEDPAGSGILSEPGTVLHCRADGGSLRSLPEAGGQATLRRHPDGRALPCAGSGGDRRRRGPVALLERALRGDAVHVVAAAPDCVARPGCPAARHASEFPRGSVALLDEDDPSGRSGVRRLAAGLASPRDTGRRKRPCQGHKCSQVLPEGPGIQADRAARVEHMAIIKKTNLLYGSALPKLQFQWWIW